MGSTRRIVVAVLAGWVAVCAAVGTIPAGADDRGAVRLSSGDEYTYSSARPMAMTSAAYLDPIACTEEPDAASCDAYFVDLALDPSEDATNFLLLQLSWDGGYSPPPLFAVATGLSFGDVNDYAISVWERDEEGDYARLSDVTGGLANPENIGLITTKDHYAVTVQVVKGASLGYEFSMKFSNEIFAAPFESLDPALRDPGGFAAPVDRSDAPDASVAPVVPDAVAVSPSVVSEPVATDLAASLPAPATLREVAPDLDFAGFRGSVDDRLEGDLAGVQHTSSASTLADADPPATALVFFWLLLVPVGLALVLFAAMRRRRPVALAV